jgi:hypothetical protein
MNAEDGQIVAKVDGVGCSERSASIAVLLLRTSLFWMLATASFTSVHAQGVTTISNGGFEIPEVQSLQIAAGSTNLPGWTVEGSGLAVTLVRTGYGESPYQGQQFLLFDNGVDSANSEPSDSISQTIATTVGQTYAVTYAVVQPDSPGVFEASAVASDGSVLSTNDYAVQAAEFYEWTLYQLFFTATTTNTTLTFVDLAATAADEGDAIPMGLDDVSIAAVVAPPTITEALSNETVAVGTVVTFSASATAAGAMTIQWYYETSAIQGATNTSLTVTADQSAEGFYTATFTDAGGPSSTSCLLKLDNNILINGGFEAPPAPDGGAYGPGGNPLPGWTILDGIIYLCYNPPPNPGSGFPTAYQGNQFIAFNEGGMSFGGSLAQTFQTTLDQSYTVSFAVGGGSDSGSDDNLGATITSASGSVLSQTNCVAIDGWVPNQMSFIATTTNTTVTFADEEPGGGPGRTLALDAVTVAKSSSLLGISTGTNEVILSWPATSEGFHLETTGSIGTNWVAFSATLVTNSGSVTATVLLSPTTSFFRLKYP